MHLAQLHDLDHRIKIKWSTF